MPRLATLATLSLVSLFVVGCGEEKISTVEYYQNNPDKRSAKIEQCLNAKKLSDSELKDCDNAKRADYLHKESQPIDFSSLMKIDDNQAKQSNNAQEK